MTLWRWLGRAVADGRVLQEGRGTRSEPYLYTLPGMVEKWQQDFLASFLKDAPGDAARGTSPPAPGGVNAPGP
jgi:hypothetical protein